LKAACTDAVGAVFVFLDLLECEAERIAEPSLTDGQHLAPHADAATDVAIDWTR
jgi:hypothetical protein